jgi:hypothetical protein
MHSIIGRPALIFDAAAAPAAAGPAGPTPSIRMLGPVYCDYILIFSKTREEHLMHVQMVFETLTAPPPALRQGLQVPIHQLLGRLPRPCHLAVDQGKVAAVAEWATPTSCTNLNVRRFISLANYYREFVLRFSALAAAASLTILCTGSARASLRFSWIPQSSRASPRST